MLVDANAERLERAFLVGCVVVEEVLDGFIEAQPTDFRSDGQALGDVPLSQAQESQGIAFFRAFGAFLKPPAIAVLAYPPNPPTPF
jgi:hypothetical protein